jgi:hypothetical protein
MTGLPSPPADALALGELLAQQIRDEALAEGGVLPFSRYMELCLYSPGLGYYSAGLQKFGAAGDFVTAPEISPLFGRCLARSCATVLQACDGDILEVGAGSGRLAVDLLAGLEQLDRLPGCYLILERGADLRERQRSLLGSDLPPLPGGLPGWMSCRPAFAVPYWRTRCWMPCRWSAFAGMASRSGVCACTRQAVVLSGRHALQRLPGCHP